MTNNDKTKFFSKSQVLSLLSLAICLTIFCSFGYLFISPSDVFKDEEIAEKGKFFLWRKYIQIAGDTLVETHTIGIEYPLTIRINETQKVIFNYSGFTQPALGLPIVLGQNTTVKLDSTTFNISPKSEQTLSEVSKSFQTQWYIEPLKKGKHYLYIDIFDLGIPQKILSKVNSDLCKKTLVNSNNEYFGKIYTNEDEVASNPEATRHKVSISTNGICSKVEPSGLIELPITIATVWGINEVTARIIFILSGVTSLVFLLKILKTYKSINYFNKNQGDIFMSSIKENYGLANNEGDVSNSKFARTINDNNQTVSGNDNITAQGNNSTFNQSQVSQSTNEQITPTEVVEMLAYLQEKIQSLTALSEVDREKSVKRLEASKVEVQETEPNKDSIANSLKRVNNTLNEAGKTTKEVKELVNELFPTVVKVAGYLGYAAGTIWSMLP